jgi:hypothetical protein
MCTNCGDKFKNLENHECYIQPPKPVEKVDNFGVFDFECEKLDNGLNRVVLAVVKTSLGDQKVFYNIDQFCEFMFNHREKITFVAHNARGYDSHFILKWLVAKGITPKIILQGSNIMMLSHEKVKIIDTLSHFPGTELRKLPSIFGLQSMKGYFPYEFISHRNMGYVGNIPPMEQFGKQVNFKGFKEWYDEKSKRPWSYDDELLKYCEDDVKVLWESCEKYRELFQEITQTDPFAFCTLASHCQYIYRKLFMPEDSIPLTPDEFGLKSSVSKKELQWLYLINPNMQRQKRVHTRSGKSYIVDGYDATQNEVYQFYGCFWHGCPKCYPEGINDVSKKSFKSLLKTTETIKTELSTTFRVIHIWECDFNNLCKIESMPNVDEYTPLVQKDAMFGGRTEVFKAYGLNIKNGGYVDVTSLYPTVMKYDPYPSGTRRNIKRPA